MRRYLRLSGLKRTLIERGQHCGLRDGLVNLVLTLFDHRLEVF
jgi:hypothetical protein